MGNSAVAQTTLTDGTGGNNITIYFGYGFGLFLGVSVAGGISGFFHTTQLSSSSLLLLLKRMHF